MYIREKKTLDKAKGLYSYALKCRKCGYTAVVEGSEKKELVLSSLKCRNCDKVNEEKARVAAEAAKSAEVRHAAKVTPKVAPEKKAKKTRSLKRSR